MTALQEISTISGNCALVVAALVPGAWCQN